MGKGKKKKAEPIPLVKPEAEYGDEVEVAMGWDRISVMHPNPMQPPGGPLYTFSTGSGISNGTPPTVVAAMASATVPLLSTVPPTSAPSTRAKDRQTKREEVPSGLAAVPRPPPRATNIAPRALRSLADAEQKRKVAEEELKAKMSDEDAVNAVAEYDRLKFSEAKEDLRAEIHVLEEIRQKARMKYEDALERQKMEFQQKRFRIEESIAKLKEAHGRMEAELSEKKTVLAKRDQSQREHSEMQVTHSDAVKELQREMQTQKAKLRDTMNKRLAHTVEDMTKLTSNQRETRQQQAVAESEKLVNELMVLERKSKKLNAQNTKLSSQAEVTSRDRALEAERRGLLLQKNAVLSHEIKQLVSQLQAMERNYAQKVSLAAPSTEVQNLSDTVDRQYDMILKLKSELDKVNDDIGICQTNISKSSATHLLTTTNSTQLVDLSLSPAMVSQLRKACQDTAATLESTLGETGKKPIRLCDLQDPREKLHIQNHFARLIRYHISEFTPRAPAAM